MLNQENELKKKYTAGDMIVELARDVVTSRTAWILVFGAMLVGGYALETYQLQMKNAEQETVIRQTPAGTFALDMMTDCRESGAMFSGGPATANCISQTVSAAQNLRGPAFAEDVRTALVQKYVAK